MRYLAIGNNAKTVKSDAGGEYLTAIMYLAPADMVPGINLCPMAELAQCKAPCLFSAGRGAFASVQDARVAKTIEFRDDREAFMLQLVADIRTARRKANKLGVKLAVRLNGTSDIAWENVMFWYGDRYLNLMELFPDVQFYDYTKLPGRKVPANYHLTVSYSGANAAYAEKASKTPHNIAVVFSGALPATYLGRPVINGDKDDLRFLDPAGVVVGLTAKGKAKKDTSGFVIRLQEVA